MGTAEPSPIRSAREKFITTKGKAKLSAANAVSPKMRPTNIPSSSPYKADASMLNAPGRAAIKNNFIGGVLAKRFLEFMYPSPWLNGFHAG